MSIDFAFVADRAQIPPLHVALYSLANTLEASSHPNVFIFHEGWTHSDQALLRRTVALSGNRVNMVFRPVDLPTIEGANPLHGCMLAYGRLFLADWLDDIDSVLYLDCDLLIGTSLCPLFELPLSRNLALVGEFGDRRWCTDTDLYKAAGLCLEGGTFNSGVMLLNLALWRDENITSRCLSIAKEYSGMFRTADQGLLNVALDGRVGSFGPKYNRMLYSDAQPLEYPPHEVLHFIGSPKPWDILGYKLHTNFELWHAIYKRTSLGTVPLSRHRSLLRTLRIMPRTIRRLARSIRK